VSDRCRPPHPPRPPLPPHARPQISLSDFLTLFSARTRTWFWERRPGYALGVACLFATGTSTMMSLFWDDIVKTEDAQMLGLRRSRYACVSVWIYCTLWFLVQDVAKVLAYNVLEYLTRVDAERVKEVTARGAIAAMIDADTKSARSRGIGGAGAGSHMHMEAELTSVGGGAAMETRLKSLEGELSEVKALLRTALAGKVAA